MDITLAKDFKEFLKLLNSNEIDYLLIGGYAVAYHGYPRATNDLDIWVSTDAENIKKLVLVMQQFGFTSPQLTPELFTGDKVIRMGIPPIRIEILTHISGVQFEDCYRHRTIDIIDDTKINIIGLIDLKNNKKASGRHKDLDDLENLP